MFLILLLMKLVTYIMLFPKFLCYELVDLFFYIKNQRWKIFEKWGMHLYIGRFGHCKTSSMVADSYALCKQYPQLSIVTNLKLTNFPKHTQIKKLTTINDILNAEENTLILIDEIGTIFNSRDFKNGDSMPKILFQHICQCRHRHLMIYGTVQDWEDVDIQIRRKTATVRKCSAFFSHPFTRLQSYTIFDGKDYDKAIANINYPISPIGFKARVQTDKIRKLYDTKEMVQTLLKAKYDDDATILANQGIETGSSGIFDRHTRSRYKAQKQAL